ncbi:MAG: hypothetical protein PHY80_03845 [Rickettsiales bacterium]|nr:hypothetical protein [Rickettsiales bacterium]
MNKFIHSSIMVLLLSITNNAYAIVGGTAVSDFEAHKKLNTIDQHLIEQKELIDSNSKIFTEIKDSVIGNSINTYSVISNNNSSGLISDIKVPDILEGNKITIINKNLDKLYPLQNLSVSEDMANKARQQQQQQAELKQIIIYTTNIINNSETRDSEIEILARENDQTKRLKEALDLQNKIALENLVELKKNNILLALKLRSEAKESYSGLINVSTVSPLSEAEEYQKSGFKKKYPNSKYNQMLGN